MTTLRSLPNIVLMNTKLGGSPIPSLSEAQAIIRAYMARRRRGHPAIELSRPYALFPASKAARRIAQTGWPDYWPNYDRSGVYLILDGKLQVLYVGKASMGSRLYQRLGTYFGYFPGRGRQGPCRIKRSGWLIRSRYVVTASVPEDATWEAAGLEEFLIGRLQPLGNTIGRRTT